MSISMGDLAQGFQMRNRSSAMKQDIQRLTTELTTGQVANVRTTLAGNYSFLTDVQRKSEVLDSYGIATKEATQFTSAMQLALGNFATLAQDLSSGLLSAGTSALGANGSAVISDARATLDGLMGTLNSETAGRQMFAGNATNQRPIVDSETLITDLKAAMAGATNVADMMTAAQTWFDDPAGFAATAYQGSTEPMSTFALSPNESVAVDLRADDPGFARAIRGAALAAIADDPAFGLSLEAQSELFSLVGQDMLVGQDEIIGLQSKVGFAEARIEAVATRNAAEITSLGMTRNTLLEADPYEVATKLEEVQFQLQSLYSVTVRSSQLSLLNYI